MNLHQNGLIRLLLPTIRASLSASCSEVQLETGELIASPQTANDQVYFLTHATVALVVRDSAHPDTAGVALGLTGSEGAVGLQQALGMGTGVFTLQVQTGGTAWKIDGAALARMAQCNLPMLLTFGRYLWTVSQEVAATAANAQLHGVHQRLAAWIFLSATRGRANELFLTHAHLADMLGVRRASVTEAALLLKDRGLVDYQRGLIHILDLPGLRLVAQ